ncbi:adenylosuccinate synthase [Dehalogenimonas formicexedens]|uniref:Adenylosuccinate synthetase n=1 Tax=Dehalogenimonas formicexedens TaxID=1839801 RepID=A0A1P8F7S7_9CHLR|nr:adenylosuccinate synthase [Dehalogenimonas formicexedens]APV44536.1 adenylosuccinate synthase [Dehalogenimonas formicexedens]
MAVTIIVGAQWGDEGKGKVIDMLAERADAVVRFSGGDNAGHTVINPQGTFKLHLIPSGVFYPHCTCVIGNGVVVNPEIFVSERRELNTRGVSTDNVFISDRAHLVMPYHIQLDGLEEQARGKKSLGTTLRGIGPAFADKVARMGIRAGDLLDPGILRNRLEYVLEYKNQILTRLYGEKPIDINDLYERCRGYAEALKSNIRETSTMLNDMVDEGKAVLLEGAQGALLDTDFGTYPYATSSSPLSAGGCLGAGIGPTRVNDVLGVFKAYCSRVGAGPFPTELLDATGDRIRDLAHEYGTTTGRPRRIGWFDGVAARFSTRINGMTGMAITRLDILDSFDEIKVCTAYQLDGQTLNDFPAEPALLNKCKPVYETLQGWKKSTTGLTRLESLPREARAFIARLEELAGCPACYVCIGPVREQTIELKKLI